MKLRFQQKKFVIQQIFKKFTFDLPTVKPLNRGISLNRH